MRAVAVVDDDEAPAGSAQAGLWFLDRLHDHSPAGAVARVYEVDGALDPAALRAAWAVVVDRHRVLRTTLVERDGSPVRKVERSAPESFTWVDLSSLPGDLARERADALCHAWTAEPVDLSALPVAWLRAVRVAKDEHRLVLITHGAVADRTSVAVLLDEVSLVYRTGPTALPDDPPQYETHTRAERDLDHGAALRWWRHTMPHTVPPPDLVVDAAPPVPRARDGVVRFAWGARVAAQAARIAAEAGGALVDVLAAAVQCLIARHAAAEHVVVGVPGTRPAGFERAVGPFGDLLPLPADLGGRPTFRTLVDRTATLRREAERHRVPYDVLVRELAPPRDPARPPWHDALVAVEDPAARLDLRTATARPVSVHDGSRWALLAVVVDDHDYLHGALHHEAGTLHPSSARRLLDQLHTLLTAALEDPDTAVDQLPLHRPDRQRYGHLDTPSTPLVHESVLRHASSAPSAVAVRWEGAAVTYDELAGRAARMAHVLATPTGGPVAVRLPPGPALVASLLGAWAAGRHVVCLETEDRGERSRAVLAELRPEDLVCADEDALTRWYADAVGGRLIAPSADDPAPGHPGHTVDHTDLAYIAHTSGSTGTPKAIPHHHATLAQFTRWFADEFRIGPGDRIAHWSNPAYDASLGEIFAALVAGATVHPAPLAARMNPDRLVDWLAAERISHFQTVPSFAREVLRALSGRRLPALTHLLLAGEPLPGDLVARVHAALPGTRLVNLYGPTETILATWQPVADPVAGTAPIGRPIPGRQVLVVDGRDEPCAPGVTGEVVVRGPHVTAGYVGAGSTDAFRPLDGVPAVAGSTYRTGDLARERWDGALEFRGRRDQQVKVAGKRLELAEVEAALAADASVAECAVVPVTDAQGLVTRLAAFVVPRAGPDGLPLGSAAVWRDRIRRWFGSSTLAVSVKPLQRLPRNTGGKVDRRALADPGRVTRGVHREPATAGERAVADAWSSVLGLDRIGRDDDFFRLGGHSLLLPRVTQRIRERCGVRLHPRDLLAHPVLADLAALVERLAPLGSNDTDDNDGVRNLDHS